MLHQLPFHTLVVAAAMSPTVGAALLAHSLDLGLSTGHPPTESPPMHTTAMPRDRPNSGGLEKEEKVVGGLGREEMGEMEGKLPRVQRKGQEAPRRALEIGREVLVVEDTPNTLYAS
jgi:hypothetical protein